MRCAAKVLFALLAGIYTQMQAVGAIPVSSEGTGVITFNTPPSSNDWSTLSVGGEGGNARIVWPAELDADVQLLAATDIVLPLGGSSSLPPSQNNAGIWNSAGQFLQTKVGNNAYAVIMATLRNDTASDIYSLAIGYDLGVFNDTLTSETIRAYRAYFSLTGQPGSWQAIPELCVDGPGSLMTVINPGIWPGGAVLYLLWADDNAVGSDQAYSIDNFFAAQAAPGASLTLLTNGQTFREGAPIPLHAMVASDVPITDVTFFDNFAPVGAAYQWPFSVAYSNASAGGHDFVVIAGDASGNFFESETVHVDVLPNTPPILSFTSPSNQMFAAGDTIPFAATGLDLEGSVVRVDFYVDGLLSHHYPYFTSPYPPIYTNFLFTLSDVREGRHTIAAVAVDDATFRATNTISIVATNPPGLVILVPNGAAWKYADDGLDQGTAWRGVSFDDTGWKQGAGEFGFGDGPVRNRPESTTISFGPDPKRKPLTTYFRRSFTVRDPALVTNLVVRLMGEPGAVVYLNGTEVFRRYITAYPVLFTTRSLVTDFNDHTLFVSTNVSPLLLRSGTNVVAVETHLQSPQDSFLSFDLVLWAQPGMPALTITRFGNEQAELNWPFAAQDYGIRSANAVGGPWETVTEPDVPLAGLHRVHVDLRGSQKFFRLE